MSTVVSGGKSGGDVLELGLGQELELACQGRPWDIQNSSYMLPQELRLSLSDAKCNKVSGKIMRNENEFVDFETSSKH